MNNAQVHGCQYEGWQCFHCGEVFTTVGSAEDHFGGAQGALTGCQIKAGEERGLLMELRKAENEVRNWNETAAQYARNADFYRGLLDQCAAHLGPDVFVSDDGLVQDEPLRLKIPELVQQLANQEKP